MQEKKKDSVINAYQKLCFIYLFRNSNMSQNEKNQKVIQFK